MPKFIGRTIPGATRLEDNAIMDRSVYVRLSYSQAVRLDPAHVICSLDTSDRGGRGSLAKRWYTWYARRQDVCQTPRPARTDCMTVKAFGGMLPEALRAIEAFARAL